MLLTSRRLGPLMATQALGALNDNLFKNALVVLILFQGAGGHGPALVALSGGVFILPYLLFSATAGQIADRFDKARSIVRLKLLELALMTVGAAGFLADSQPLLFLVLFGLGVQAAFFGPLKYGILPDHLSGRELVAGNGLVEAGTFIGILAGTIIGSAMLPMPHGAVLVAASGVLVALAGMGAARLIPPAPALGEARPVGWNVLRDTAGLLRAARQNQAVWLCIVGLSWFWALGATVLAGLPTAVRDELGGGSGVFTLLLTAFSVGVGAGSVGCGRLLRGQVSAWPVPWAAAGLSLFLLDFGLALRGAAGLGTVAAVMGSVAGWRMVMDLLLLAACGGVYSVPLYAMMQERAAAGAKGSAVAANNVVNAAAMVVAAVALAAVAAFGGPVVGVLAVVAVANLGMAVWARQSGLARL